MSPRKMPEQKPWKSKQDVGTQPEFLRAVERRFGPIRWDLAAHRDNHVVPQYLGPGSTHGEDSLKVSWHLLGGLLFLNPEFSDIDPWAEKCAAEGARGARVKMLVPASIGTDWFREHVHHKALWLALSPRLTFVGHKDPYPRDLILCCYGPWVAPGFDCWRWRE